MSREIKFRAWDSINKCYYTEPFFVSGDGTPYTYNPDFKHVEEYDAINPVMGIVLEQYTGLKDKNGKEIYEGDLVQFELEEGSVVAPVVFAHGYFAYATFNIVHIAMPLYKISHWCVVVGNIHQNIELIK